ncbi:hypothetical protein M407DRAFT_158216 [Tulasnella calospora MUT 4182]|uniref:BTB domain-containing protein n=1 Tax=Tulasnella calospora MUT 4182 TaxID=1051891 RepID=A0A0C3QFD8_9AGAM|nr:hypothetical protein M407DRAFT_158216 [Tulasnella calospora MUT 4182]
MQSEVFDGMMDIPQPPVDLGPNGTDLPVVDLHDNEIQVMDMLQLIYHPESVVGILPVPKAFGLLASAMPLLKKYQMDRLLASCVKRVQQDCPETLQDWDIRAAKLSGILSAVTSPEHSKFTTVWANNLVVDPVSVILLTRDFPELGSMAAAAFYDLSRSAHTFDDVMHPDGALEFLESGGISVHYELLTAGEWRRLWHGTNAMRAEIRATSDDPRRRLGQTMDMPSELEHPGCPEPTGRSREFISHVLKDSIAREYPDPLMLLKEVGEGNISDSDLRCQTCRYGVAAYLLQYRHIIWGLLPKFFAM